MLHHAVFHYEGIQKHFLCYLNKFKVIYVICVHFSPSHLKQTLLGCKIRVKGKKPQKTKL